MAIAITTALAVAVVALSLTEVVAYTRKRYDLSARLLTAELVALAGLLALAAAARDWWFTGLWVSCIALTVWNLRRSIRRREAQTA